MARVGDSSRTDTDTDYSRRHLLVGWWSLFIFAVLGLVLESLHAFKVRAYLDVSNEARRLMWTLAHAHGALLSLVHIIYGLCLWAVPGLGRRRQRLVSSCLVGATIALPGGFFLGGITFYGGDPGVGAALVPLGASLLLIAIFFVARAVVVSRFDRRSL